MKKSIEQERIGGHTVHLGDCRVWAEIFYLDSATDYREYLPSEHSPFGGANCESCFGPDQTSVIDFPLSDCDASE